MTQISETKRIIQNKNIAILRLLSTHLFLVFSFLMTINAQGEGFDQVDPPHWWTQMPSDTLEVMIHKKGIGENKTSIDKNGPGVELLSISKFSNPNYITLHVLISKEAKSQTFTIKSKGKAGVFSHNYTLHERKAHKRGLDQSDIIYLITPDRFANGNDANDSFAEMTQTGVNRDEPYDRHGGDLAGIIDKLDYIQDLGMTAIWPNPVLENNQPHESYHGYAITDYYNIDPRFGSNADYQTLSDELHSRGMKLIQDVIYNHIGNEHYLFKDMPDSTWFHFWDEYQRTNYRAPSLMDPYASDYDKNIMTDGWFDKHMPDLNQHNEFVSRYLIQQTIWWIETFQIDALRIDTYAYPDQAFMRDWASEVKAAFPDIFLFAETWVHGRTVQGWFVDGGLAPVPNGIDAVTDFQMYYAINDALTKNHGWADGLSKLYYTLSGDYIYERPQDMVTFLDNHDLARFLGYVNGDLRKMKIGLGWLFTLRGIPSLYYGTEILMKSTDGHGLIRADFPGGWPTDTINKFNRAERTLDENAVFDYIQALAKLRKENATIQNGKLTQFVPKDGVYIYFRSDENDTFMIAVNASEDEKQITLNNYSECIEEKTRGVDLYGNTVELKDGLSLSPISIQVLRLK